jgi:hypothetical protein
VIALGGCDDDTAGADDLAMPLYDFATVHDLATSDLTAAPPEMCVPNPPDAFDVSVDAGGFCAGTPIAGTCVQTFFAKLAECFVPAGCCRNGPGSITVTMAWESGAYYSTYAIDQERHYAMINQSCANSRRSGLPDTDRWVGADGSTLALVLSTGVLTCPDGSTVNIGTLSGQCAELDALLHPAPPLGCFQAFPNCCVPQP